MPCLQLPGGILFLWHIAVAQQHSPEDLVLAARRTGVTDRRVLAAIRATPRAAFVPLGYAWAAHEDRPLPIPHGQVTTQPALSAIMIARLGLAAGWRLSDCPAEAEDGRVAVWESSGSIGRGGTQLDFMGHGGRQQERVLWPAADGRYLSYHRAVNGWLNLSGTGGSAMLWLTFALSLVAALSTAIITLFRFGDRWLMYRALSNGLMSAGWALVNSPGTDAGAWDLFTAATDAAKAGYNAACQPAVILAAQPKADDHGGSQD